MVPVSVTIAPAKFESQDRASSMQQVPLASFSWTTLGGADSLSLANCSWRLAKVGGLKLDELDVDDVDDKFESSRGLS